LRWKVYNVSAPMFLAVLSEFLLALKIESGIFACLGLLLVFNVLRLIMVLRNNKSATIVTALILLVSLAAIIGLAAGIKPLLVLGLAVLPLELLSALPSRETSPSGSETG